MGHLLNLNFGHFGDGVLQMHSDDLFDERVGLHWFVPGPGELLPPRADSGLKSGFDVAVRRLDGLLEVRLVLLDPAHLTADPASAPPQEVAGARCFGYANYRTLDEPTIRLAPSILLKAWNVDGAASGIYSLVGEAPSRLIRDLRVESPRPHELGARLRRASRRRTGAAPTTTSTLR